MAEHAVLAHSRVDGRYDVDRSRWGGTNEMLAAVLNGAEPQHLEGVEWRCWRRGVTFPTLLEHLEYLSTSVCYRVTAQTTPFLVLWFGLPLRDESAASTAGALVSVHSLADARTIRAAFRRLKGTLTDALAAGDLPASVAPYILVAWVTGSPFRETYLSPAFQAAAED